ncbi:MAG: hypothetical protein WCO54_06540 [Bacteroidota bacterium]
MEINKIIPKKENEGKGFKYTVTDEQIREYAKWTLEEKLQWIFETNELLAKVQAPEERERARVIKHKVMY